MQKSFLPRKHEIKEKHEKDKPATDEAQVEFYFALFFICVYQWHIPSWFFVVFSVFSNLTGLTLSLSVI